jgi:hypothetical protein
MTSLNNNYCYSVKSKSNINEQCTNKCKQNDLFCGKHLNSKNIILFKTNFVSKDESKDESFDESKQIYSKDKLFEIITNNKNISVYSVRQSIKNCDLHKLIDTKKSKQFLIESIKNIIIKERFYESHQKYIINIQKNFRRWLVYRKKICCNDNDILTFSSKFEIEDKYFYVLDDLLINKKYAYDIRTLLQIIESDYPSCPYTFRTFTENEINKINKHKNRLIKYGVDIEIKKNVLTPEEEINMKIKDVFYQINMLDNYTNHAWFKNLEINDLVKLYIVSEDIWNYRSGMDLNSKKRIVKDGIVFNIPIHFIKSTKSKMKLQEIILNDYFRIISEGINREEKKLGAILILTGLVEISYEAADALPHLIQ